MSFNRLPWITASLCLLTLGSDVTSSAADKARVLNESITIRWTGENDRYASYQAEQADGSNKAVVIDLQTQTRLDPADYPAELQELREQSAGADIELKPLATWQRSRNGNADTHIRFVNLLKQEVELVWLDADGQMTEYGRLAPGAEREQHTFVGHVWLLRDSSQKVLAGVVNSTARTGVFKLNESVTPPSREARGGRGSRPQRDRGPRSEAPPANLFFKDHNLWMSASDAGEPLPVTTDGTQSRPYEGRIQWSPDGNYFCCFQVQKATQRQIPLVESTPSDQLQPRMRMIDYTKPGDPLDHPRLWIFSADRSRRMLVDESLCPNPFEIIQVEWKPDSTAVRFVYNQRGHQVLRVLEMNALTGKTRTIVDETSKTFIDYAGKFYLRYLDYTNELIWMSERDGWNHLYLIDQATGQVKRQLTSGEWVVRDVVDVDEAARTLLISAGGYVAGQDPYYRHLLRVPLDDGPIVRLTDGDGDHQWDFSPRKRYLIDRYSRVDLPPVTNIRSAETGQLVAKCEEADASSLIASGWSLPQHFVAKGRDGVTDIYGMLILPPGFDPNRKYPVLEEIYAGPHSAHVPKTFQRFTHLQDAALGSDGKSFIIVKIDGMGTSHRSKAFHDVCWKNIADAGFPDRIAWMKAAAEKFPQMDLERVGVWGGSAGGQNAMRALIAHHDFYKAAVADCGCHDNRMDKIWWNELWMGWPVESHYAEQSNVTQAHRMEGKLLLTVGEIDSNVDPASTMQVVHALIKANKMFELLVFPGANHGAGSSRYGVQRRDDFFKRAFYP